MKFDELPKNPFGNPPIGFYADIDFGDIEPDGYDRYFSFGKWNEETNEDGNGVDDDKIFYYPTLDEMEFYQYTPTYDGWIIIPGTISLVYDKKEVL